MTFEGFVDQPIGTLFIVEPGTGGTRLVRYHWDHGGWRW